MQATSSGATPRMQAIHLGVPGSPPALALEGSQRRPSREKDDLPPELTPSPKAPKTDGSADAASASRGASRNVSLDCEDEVRREAVAAAAAIATGTSAIKGEEINLSLIHI